MQNDTNLPEMLIKSLMSMSQKEKNTGEEVEKLINENLTGSQKEKLHSVLSDPQKINQLLSSPQAKLLFERFSGKNSTNNTDGFKQN